MKILDIIAEDKSLTEGILANWFKRPFVNYMEKRAATKVVAEIEKKYADDIAKQTACKELSEKYGKYLAERELAGQTPIPLERLILKQKEYRGTSFASDTEFIDLTTRLAQVKKTQYLKDGARAGKEAGKTAGKATSAEVSATTTAIEAGDKISKNMVGDIVRKAQLWLQIIGGSALWIGIHRDWSEDLKTNEAQFAKGTLPAVDEKFFPAVVTKGVPVSTDGSTIYYRDWNDGMKKHPYTYDNEFGRLNAWKQWRNSVALERYRDRMAAGIVGFTFASGAYWPLSKIQWATRVAKAVDVSKSAPLLKRYGSRTLQAIIAAANTTGLIYFTKQMSGKDMNEALQSIMLHDLITSTEDAREIFWSSAMGSVMVHAAAIHLFGSLIEVVGEMAGVGTQPRIADEPPANTSDVGAADPMQQDPSQRNTTVDQTDSTGKQQTPVAKPVEKNPPPEKKAADTTRPEENTAAARGAKFTQAMDAGAATVVIGNRTYKTADFKDDGGYWTNPKTGESFVKN